MNKTPHGGQTNIRRHRKKKFVDLAPGIYATLPSKRERARI